MQVIPYQYQFNFPIFQNRQNTFEQLTAPNVFIPSFNLGLGELPDLRQNNPVSTTPNNTPEVIVIDNKTDSKPSGYSLECLLIGANCPDSLLGSGISTIAGFFQKVSLLLLALVLIVVGLYFLAKSTDEGKILIGAASDGVL